jgi:hypothetical protein
MGFDHDAAGFAPTAKPALFQHGKVAPVTDPQLAKPVVLSRNRQPMVGL